MISTLLTILSLLFVWTSHADTVTYEQPRYRYSSDVQYRHNKCWDSSTWFRYVLTADEDTTIETFWFEIVWELNEVSYLTIQQLDVYDYTIVWWEYLQQNNAWIVTFDWLDIDLKKWETIRIDIDAIWSCIQDYEFSVQLNTIRTSTASESKEIDKFTVVSKIIHDSDEMSEYDLYIDTIQINSETKKIETTVCLDRTDSWEYEWVSGIIDIYVPELGTTVENNFYWLKWEQWCKVNQTLYSEVWIEKRWTYTIQWLITERHNRISDKNNWNNYEIQTVDIPDVRTTLWTLERKNKKETWPKNKANFQLCSTQWRTKVWWPWFEAKYTMKNIHTWYTYRWRKQINQYLDIWECLWFSFRRDDLWVNDIWNHEFLISFEDPSFGVTVHTLVEENLVLSSSETYNEVRDRMPDLAIKDVIYTKDQLTFEICNKWWVDYPWEYTLSIWLTTEDPKKYSWSRWIWEKFSMTFNKWTCEYAYIDTKIINTYIIKQENTTNTSGEDAKFIWLLNISIFKLKERQAEFIESNNFITMKYSNTHSYPDSPTPKSKLLNICKLTDCEPLQEKILLYFWDMETEKETRILDVLFESYVVQETSLRNKDLIQLIFQTLWVYM